MWFIKSYPLLNNKLLLFMTPVIKVENLGKKYTISHKQCEAYSSLRDALTNSVAMFGKRLIRPFRCSLDAHPSPLVPDSEDFWALKDVSFEVKQGDRIGIIGRNGAGKSTLLKILSRITEPTTGSIKIKGRVASLLEVGTGFHPELTGRENIFLNGAILGMPRVEIRRRFDEIVSFSEIEKFLDTPVKRYSSGMYVRLAFAVAAHLEPEILIVDEVLAVGDAQFQMKCLGKMEDVSAKEGRTVLFVSHNMQAISSLCNKGIFLESGSVKLIDDASRVVNAYMNSELPSLDLSSKELHNHKIRDCKISNPSSIFKWTEIHIENSIGECSNALKFGEPFDIVFGGVASENCENVRIGFSISSNQVGFIFSSHQLYNGLPDTIQKGFAEYRVRMDPNILAPGCYNVGIAADGTGKVADYTVNNAISFSISDAPYDQTKQWRSSINSGIMYYPCTWNLILDQT